MTIETIYNELKEITRYSDKSLNELEFNELLKFQEKLEKEIRKSASYKTTSKTRVNAIQKVASKDECRLALQGYGIFGEYKGVTDSYHAILIKQDEMPLPLVACDSDLEKYGINKKEYQDKYGETSIINAVYPNLMACLTTEYNKDNQLTLDMDDLTAFIKTHKKDKRQLYQLGQCKYEAKFIKNVVDVIGKDCKIYFQSELKPLYFVNDKEEIGVVLPIREF